MTTGCSLQGNAACLGCVYDAPLLLVFIADLARLRAVSNELGEPGEGLDYLQAFIFAIADASFGAQNAVVAIESLGLGCYCIGAMHSLPERSE